MATFEVLLLLAVAAFLAGAAGSYLGIGGGVFLIPFMTLALGLDIKVAIATSLIGVIATSSGAAAVYVRDHLTNLRLAMFLEVATTIGAIIGALVALLVPAVFLYVAFGAVVLYAAATMVRIRETAKERSYRGGEEPALVKRLNLSSVYFDQEDQAVYRYRVDRPGAGFGVSAAAGLFFRLLRGAPSRGRRRGRGHEPPDLSRPERRRPRVRCRPPVRVHPRRRQECRAPRPLRAAAVPHSAARRVHTGGISQPRGSRPDRDADGPRLAEPALVRGRPGPHVRPDDGDRPGEPPDQRLPARMSLYPRRSLRSRGQGRRRSHRRRLVEARRAAAVRFVPGPTVRESWPWTHERGTGPFGPGCCGDPDRSMLDLRWTHGPVRRPGGPRRPQARAVGVRHVSHRIEGRSRDRREGGIPLDATRARGPGTAESRGEPGSRKAGLRTDSEGTGRRSPGHRRHPRYSLRPRGPPGESALPPRPLPQARPRRASDPLAVPALHGKGVRPVRRHGEDVPDERGGGHRRGGHA